MHIISNIDLYLGQNNPKNVCVMAKTIIIMYKIVDENNNDITPKTAANEISATLGVNEITKEDCVGITMTLTAIFRRIGGNSLIRHLFPRNPHKVPMELCNNDPDRFSYFVQECWVGRSEY